MIVLSEMGSENYTMHICVYINVADLFIMLFLSTLLRRINVNLAHSRLTRCLNAS